MTSEKKRSPLLVEEDWWTVWFGLTILLVATVLGILTLSGSITAKKVPKMGKWKNNPTDVFYLAKKTPIDLHEGTTLAELADRNFKIIKPKDVFWAQEQSDIKNVGKEFKLNIYDTIGKVYSYN